MSTGHGDAASTQQFGRGGRSQALTGPAASYLIVVVTAAALLSVPFRLYPVGHADWLLFVALAACASAAQLLVVDSPGHQAYYSTAVFFLAGALLLPPPLVALMVVIAHLPDWAKNRYPWYIQDRKSTRLNSSHRL